MWHFLPHNATLESFLNVVLKGSQYWFKVLICDMFDTQLDFADNTCGDTGDNICDVTDVTTASCVLSGDGWLSEITLSSMDISKSESFFALRLFRYRILNFLFRDKSSKAYLLK